MPNNNLATAQRDSSELVRHVGTLTQQYGLTRVLHALIEHCYSQTRTADNPAEWQDAARYLTRLEGANPENRYLRPEK